MQSFSAHTYPGQSTEAVATCCRGVVHCLARANKRLRFQSTVSSCHFQSTLEAPEPRTFLPQAAAVQQDVVLPSGKSMKGHFKDSTATRSLMDYLIPSRWEFRQINQDYSMAKVLGVGGYGVVREAQCGYGVSYAVKTIMKHDNPSWQSELNALQAIDNPRILHLEASYETSSALHLVTEKCAGGGLDTHLDIRSDGTSEHEAAQLLQSMAFAVQACHNKSIVHLDVKPSNFMFREHAGDPDDLVLLDFGMATYRTPGYGCSGKLNDLEYSVGTSSYASPEVLCGQFSNAADVWSLGVVLHQMLCGERPFHASVGRRVEEAIVHGQCEFHQPQWEWISGNAKHLVLQMLDPSPHSRISLDGILSHPWLSKSLLL